MILPAQHIRQRCEAAFGQRPMISPFHERKVEGGMSYGLSIAGYDIRIAQNIELWPGEFALASSIEEFDMPTDLMGHVADKSTWARMGLAVQNTIIEPGWRGFLTLELTNHREDLLKIAKGMPIAQIIFHMLADPAEKPYRGKYDQQENRPIEARMEAAGE